MICSWTASIFFALSAGSLFLGSFLYKKSEQKRSAVVWGIILFLLLGCFHALAAAVLDLLTIPVNIISVGICDLFLSVYFWWRIIRRKERQQYEIIPIDVIFLVFAAIGAVVMARVHYDGFNLVVNYYSIDAGVHFRTAMDVVNSQQIVAMFYDTVWNALFIELLGPFTEVVFYYKIYVLGDLVHLVLSACIFYVIEQKYMKTSFTKIAGFILPFIYVIVYPLNSTIFGFSYLGMSVTVIGLLIVIVNEYIEDGICARFAIAGMMLCCLALFESYVLFVPVTFFAVLFCVCYKQYKNNQLFSRQTVVICLAIFLLPCLIGMWYSYRNIFSGDVTVSSALANEGGCYRDLYSNFLFFIPAGILGYLGLVKKKANNLLTFLLPLFLIFTAVMLWKTMNGSASSYYYYKLYFPIWLIVLLLNFYAVVHAGRQTKCLLASIFGVWFAIVVFWYNSIESKMQSHNANLVPVIRAYTYVDLISFNYTYLFWPVYEHERIDLYAYAYRNLLDKGEESVPGVIRYDDSFWFQDMTNQRFDWDFYWMDNEGLMKELEEEDANYVLVFRDSSWYVNDPEYFESLEKIYENGIGFIAEYN